MKDSINFYISTKYEVVSQSCIAKFGCNISRKPTTPKIKKLHSPNLLK